MTTVNMNPYVVRQVVFSSGERLPMLCARATGLPQFEATLYSLTELRAKGLASATIQQALRSVAVLEFVLERAGVNLGARLNEGKLLEANEIEQLASVCRRSLGALTVGQEESRRPISGSKVVSLEKVRMRPARAVDADELVSAETTAIRLFYIRNYLQWRLHAHLLKIGQRHPTFSGLLKIGEIVLKILGERMPRLCRRNPEQQREGLSAEALDLLISVVEPDSPRNPWRDAHSRQRNALAIRWLIEVGVRAGELLGIKISDIDFQKNEVFITRNADDPDDPRALQPLTKTKSRLLPLSDDLAVQTRRYIMGTRRAVKGARRHQFLFVASSSGAPLTYIALAKAFCTLRRSCTELPGDLTAHVLRHTWNGNFSDQVDAQRIAPEVEQKIRSRLMGWSETSGTAAIYTRRHVRRKSNEALLAMQKKSKMGKPR